MFRPDRGGGSKGGCSNDYIQSWLEKTQRRPAWEPPADCPQEDNVPWRPHDLDPVDTEMAPHRPSLRKRRRGSFDSSIIPDQSRLPERQSLLTTTLSKPQAARAYRGRDERGRFRRSATISPAPRQDNAGPFEKRARHKTRPDRYETRKRRNDDGGDGRKKARRTKMPGKKKFVSSREVMDNFMSDAILTEGRLTVKPALTPGLYGNARCGSRIDLPDLAYNSMGFLAYNKRRNDRAEDSSTEPREDHIRKRRERWDSSPSCVRRSESRSPIHGEYSGDEEATASLVWQRAGTGIQTTMRPNTAPVGVEAPYESRIRARYLGPARATSSLGSRDFSVPDRSPPYDTERPRKETGVYDRSTPESMAHLLWETGVFDGLERARKSTADNRQRLKRLAGRESPRYEGTEAQIHKRARFANKSTMVTLLGDRGDSVSSTLPHATATPAQAGGARNKTNPEIMENGSQAHVGPARLKSSDLPTTQATVDASAVEGLVDRTKIALMAHIPVYCHQECQTDSLWPVPQNPVYAQAGTQTEASPTQHCGRCQVSGDIISSPVQRQGSVEELLMRGEPQADSDSPCWMPNDVGQRIFGNHLPGGHEEISFKLASERHRAHPAFQGRLDLEAQHPRRTILSGVEQPLPPPCPQPTSHLHGRDAAALDVVEPVEDEPFDEGCHRYPWEYEARHLESQRSGSETSDPGAIPILRHVNRETRTYHPYPVYCRGDRATAVQSSNQSGRMAQPDRLAFRMLGEGVCLHQQDIQYPPESVPRPSRPRISSAVPNHASAYVHNTAGYIQNENQTDMSEPSHLLAHQWRTAQDDLEQERIEAYWQNRQLEFARRYGY